MAKGNKPKWQKEAEAILRKEFQGDDLSRRLEIANTLVDVASKVETPSGDAGSVVAHILQNISQELYPQAATYAGFQLGIAWEKFHNADRA